MIKTQACLREWSAKGKRWMPWLSTALTRKCNFQDSLPQMDPRSLKAHLGSVLSAPIQIQEQRCQRTSFGSKISRLLVGEKKVPTIQQPSWGRMDLSLLFNINWEWLQKKKWTRKTVSPSSNPQSCFRRISWLMILRASERSSRVRIYHYPHPTPARDHKNAASIQ